MTNHRLALLSIIVIALALRLYNLTYHSLWFDEAVSVHWARQSLPRILEVGFTLEEDRLPPLYYLLLKGWTGLAGFSEFGVRSLSVFFGVLLVPVVAAVAARLFNRRVALLSAALVALNPFLVWYSQEARMYASAVFLAALGVWVWLKWLAALNRTTKSSARHESSWTQIKANSFAPDLQNFFLIRVHLRRSASQFWSRLRYDTHFPLRLSGAYYVLFVLSFIAAVYNHLYAGFLLPALGLWLVMVYPRRWRLWFVFAIAGLIITLAYAPILLAIWRFSAESTPGEPFSELANRAWWLLQAFTVWQTPLPNWLRTTIPAVISLLALLAFLPSQSATNRNRSSNEQLVMNNEQLSLSHSSTSLPEFRPFGSAQDRPSNLPAFQPSNLPPLRLRSERTFQPSSLPTLQPPNPPIFPSSLLPTLLFLFPFLIANLLLFRNHLAFFGERYFIVMVPWLLILVAAGVDQTATFLTYRSSPPTPAFQPAKDRPKQRAAFLLISLFTLLLFLLALPGQWSIQASKEGWRQSATYLAEHATAQDGILIHPDWVRYPFQYYYRGPGQTYAAFSTITSTTDLDGPLQGVVGEHPIIWLIQSHLDRPDPNRRVEQWFAARYPLVTELYPPGISLKGYASGYQLDALPTEAKPLDLAFSNGMRLVGVQADPIAVAADQLFHPPSGWLHVTLYWTAHRPVAEAASPYVHLVGPEGVWGISLDRSNDALGLFPPARWYADAPGQLIRHDLDVNLNPATPPGVYDLIVGLQGFDQQYPISQITIQ